MIVNTYYRTDELNFGKHSGKVISEIIDKQYAYLIWCYYNMYELNFEPYLLEVLQIHENQINKPGENPELGKKMMRGFKDIQRNRYFADKKYRNLPVGSSFIPEKKQDGNRQG